MSALGPNPTRRNDPYVRWPQTLVCLHWCNNNTSPAIQRPPHDAADPYESTPRELLRGGA